MKWVTNRANRLLLPFFAWAIFNFFFSDYRFANVFKLWQYYIVHPNDGGLWFLWVLFWLSILFAIYKKSGVNVFIFYVVAYLILKRFPDYCGLEALRRLLPFFVLGYLFGVYRERVIPYIKPLVAISLPIFIVLSPIWLIEASYVPAYLMPVYSRIVPLTGIILSYKLAEYLPNKIFVYLGSLSLEFYVVHAWFMNFGIGSGYVRIIAATFVCITLSILVVEFTRRIPVVSNILFGYDFRNIKILKTSVSS